MLRFASVAVVSTLIAFPALASTPFTASLKTPKTEKERVTAYDVVWICEADTCEASLNRSTATVRVCKKVAKEVGELTAFGSEDDKLDADELAKCNAAVK